jgi:hypothetical protein
LKAIALNDLHLFDINKKTWMTIAMFGEQMPESRWGHSMTTVNNKLLIFGGMNLRCYCESVIWELDVSNKSVRNYLNNKTAKTQKQEKVLKVDALISKNNASLSAIDEDEQANVKKE